MSLIFTHAAAVVAGLAIIACACPLVISRKGLLPRLAAAVGLGIFAAVLLHVIA
jgi:hypothetical protein